MRYSLWPNEPPGAEVVVVRTNEAGERICVDVTEEHHVAVAQLKAAIQKVQNGVIWDTDKAALPKHIKFDFLYPNGKHGDIDMFIASEYGDVKQVSPLVYEVTISTNYREQIALMSESYLGSSHRIGADIDLRRDELKDFLCRYNVPLSLPTLTRAAIDLGMNMNCPLRRTGDNIPVMYRGELREQRRAVYAELAAAGATTAKWTSEQQAYAIIKGIYPDAIYQHRADWLEYQSLDIFIPSISVGIEYQGAQHYRAVPCFGGETGLQERLALDEKKRTKCTEHGITLIEWPHYAPLTAEYIQEELGKVVKETSG